jgi:hypothetical protein
MDSFAWKPAFNIGVADIDAQLYSASESTASSHIAAVL